MTIRSRTITIRVEESIYKNVKIKIAQEGITLKDYILRLINKDLSQTNG